MKKVKYYREILGEHLPIVSQWSDAEGNLFFKIAGMNFGKYTEDLVKIQRKTYEHVTDDDGSVYIERDGIKVLVKAPTDIESYSIREGVYEVAEQAFKDCERLKSLTVPYTVSDCELDKAIENAPNKDKMVITLHDWPHDCRISDEMVRDIDEGYTDELGFVYSKDKKRLLRAAPKFDEYFIMEGVERIERLAFNGCQFETVHVPYTCKLYEVSEDDFPILGNDRVAGDLVQWVTPYDKQDENPDSLCICGTEETVEKDGARYSHNMKRLLYSTIGFEADVFEVPDGVVTICDLAFAMIRTPMTLVIPSTVKVIGSNLFGNPDSRIVIKR